MSNDYLLVVGSKDSKLTGFLTKLGYNLIGTGAENRVSDVLGRSVVDLVIVDARGDFDCVDLCEYLRVRESTKTVPIICLAANESQAEQLVQRNLAGIQHVEAPYTVGSLAGKIATELRLRKFSGSDPLRASLAEANAALRDANERFRSEREQARAIQQSLLPENLPQDPRFELAVAYRPLDEVGGDWYFVQRLDQARISFQVADVTGHGLSAAFVGSMTKLALSAAAQESPDLLLRNVNRLMTPQLPEGRFITMICCLYDADTGAARIARAGHPPALAIQRKNGNAREVKPAGPAIGFLEESNFQAENVQLEPGDALVIITDGISETQNRSLEMYGMGRMASRLVASPPAWGAQQMLDALLADFNAFRGERLLKDDYTIVILKRKN